MVFDKYNPFPSKMQTDYSNHLLRISGSVLRSVQELIDFPSMITKPQNTEFEVLFKKHV